MLEYPSASFASLPSAIQVALTSAKPLRVEGATTLVEPLVIQEPLYWNLEGHAQLISGAAMDALVDIRGAKYSRFSGLRLTVPDESPVDTALLVRRAGIGGFGLNLEHVFIDGAYGCGLRVGDAGDTAQHDTTTWRNIMVRGKNKPEVPQTGLWVGAGVWANNMAHRFDDLDLSGHTTNLRVDCVAHGHFRDVMFNAGREQDILFAGNHCHIQGVRSENSTRFLVTSGGGTSGMVNTFENIIYNAQKIPIDGSWFIYNMPGVLILRAISVKGAAVAPVIKASPQAPLHIIIDGMTTEYLASDLVNGNAFVTVSVRSHTQIDASGVVIAQTVDGAQVFPA